MRVKLHFSPTQSRQVFYWCSTQSKVTLNRRRFYKVSQNASVKARHCCMCHQMWPVWGLTSWKYPEIHRRNETDSKNTETLKETCLICFSSSTHLIPDAEVKEFISYQKYSSKYRVPETSFLHVWGRLTVRSVSVPSVRFQLLFAEKSIRNTRRRLWIYEQIFTLWTLKLLRTETLSWSFNCQHRGVYYLLTCGVLLSHRWIPQAEPVWVVFTFLMQK